MQGTGSWKWKGCSRYRGDKEEQCLRVADEGAQGSNPLAGCHSAFPFTTNTPSTDEVFNNQKHIYFGFWNNLQLLISIFSE